MNEITLTEVHSDILRTARLNGRIYASERPASERPYRIYPLDRDANDVAELENAGYLVKRGKTIRQRTEYILTDKAYEWLYRHYPPLPLYNMQQSAN
jgi:hypothetical protein